MGLVLSFASKSLAQSTASFPAAPPAPAPAPVPVPAPPPAASPASSPAAAPLSTPALTAPSSPPAASGPSTSIDRPAPAPGGSPRLPANFAIGFYPALLPYRAGLPIPPGYRVEHQPATGMIAGGLATLGIAYSTALVIAASANFGDGTGWLALPVIGPWAAIGARSYHCSNDPSLASKCVSGAFSEVQTIAILSADGVVQTAGAVLFIVGLASGKDELVRSDLTSSVRITPRAVGASGFGLGVDGRF
jgi:hypothetical protein